MGIIALMVRTQAELAIHVPQISPLEGHMQTSQYTAFIDALTGIDGASQPSNGYRYLHGPLSSPTLP